MSGKDISNRVFIIAEAGINHNGKLELAYKLVDAAVYAKADAVKFQSFKAENVVTKFGKKAGYQKTATDVEETQLEMIKKFELSFEEFEKIKKYCDKRGIIFLSTPFDYQSVDFLENLVPFYKVGSGEITNLPFLEYIAKKRKPIILSTGMSKLKEIEEAIDTIVNVDPSFFSPFSSLPSLFLLHCVSSYPADFKDVNLRAMLTLREAFKFPVGYSDHTPGIEIALASVALGAKIIEKHFTIDKSLPGPDHKASVEPWELKKMVEGIRNIEKALGDGIKKPVVSEEEIKRVARRSLIATRDITPGEKIKNSDIVIKRPGTGILPKFKEKIIGMEVKKNIKKDEPFKWEDFK